VVASLYLPRRQDPGILEFRIIYAVSPHRLYLPSPPISRSNPTTVSEYCSKPLVFRIFLKPQSYDGFVLTMIHEAKKSRISYLPNASHKATGAYMGQESGTFSWKVIVAR
jgi:hypothetical protein